MCVVFADGRRRACWRCTEQQQTQHCSLNLGLIRREIEADPRRSGRDAVDLLAPAPTTAAARGSRVLFARSERAAAYLDAYLDVVDSFLAQCDLLSGIDGAQGYVLFIREQVRLLRNLAIQLHNLATTGPPRPLISFTPLLPLHLERVDRDRQQHLPVARAPRTLWPVQSSSAQASSSRLNPPTMPLCPVDAAGAYIDLRDEDEDEEVWTAASPQ